MNFSGFSESQQKRIEIAVQNLAFGQLLGIKLEAAEPGLASMSLAVRDELRQNNGVVHGGAIAALIDSAAAFAVIPLLDEDETATTVDLTISICPAFGKRGCHRISQGSPCGFTNSRNLCGGS